MAAPHTTTTRTSAQSIRVGRQRILIAAVLLVATITMASSVALAAIISAKGFSWTQFALWSVTLIIVDAHLMRIAWKYRDSLPPSSQVFVIDYTAATLWYWSLGPICQYLTMNFNKHQLAVAAFAFFWEVPLIGTLSCLIGLAMFRPVAKYLKCRQTTNPSQLLRHVEHLPLAFLYRSMILTIMAYAIGAWQISLVCGLPAIEFGKDIGNGIVLSMFLAIFYSLIFGEYLREVHTQLRSKYKISGTRRKFIKQIVIITAFMILGSLSLLALIYVRSFQLNTRNDLTAYASRAMQTAIQQATTAGKPVTNTAYFALGDRGQSWALAKTTPLPVDHPTIELKQQFASQPNGEVYETSPLERIIVFRSTASQRLVAVVFPGDYYKSLTTTLVELGFGVLFVLALTTGAIMVFFRIILNTTNRLVAAVSRAKQTGAYTPPTMMRNDEFEDLSRAFGQFIGQSHERTRELHREQARLKASIESLDMGYLMLDRHGKVILSNSSLTRLIGKPPVNGWNVSELDESLCNHGVFLKAWQAASAKLPQPSDFELSLKDNSLHIFVIPVMIAHATIGAVILIQDVTQERLLARSKEEFFSIASHELRTPLTSIKGNASMMLAYYRDTFKNPDLHQMLTDIHDSSTRLISIVNDFLDVSRLEQDDAPFAVEPVKMSDLVGTVTRELTEIARAKGIQIAIDKSLPELPPVLTNPDKTKQILYNLMGNAIKFTEHGGVSLAASVDHGYIKISVHDTGNGIPRSNQRLLFKKFQQAQSNILIRDTTRGTGLGLYISKLIIERMNGKIKLEYSAPGKGSTFSFWLPIAAAHSDEVLTI